MKGNKLLSIVFGCKGSKQTMIVEALSAVLGFIVYREFSFRLIEHMISGTYRSLKEYVASSFIKRFRREGRISRFNLYDCLSNDIMKNGVIIPEEEWKLECPREIEDPNVTDEVFFSGSNSEGACLIVRLARRSDGYGEAWIYLQLKDGKCYILLEKDATRMPPGDGISFRAGGLRIECLSPMRKWRITFNGLLCQTNQPDGRVKDEIHVKFNFLWTPLSDTYDFATDAHPSLLSSIIAENKWFKMMTLAKTLVNDQDKYQQFGQLMGTVEIDNVEAVYHLWGIKSRSFDTLSSGTSDYKVRRVRSYHGIDKLGIFFEVGIDTSLDDCRVVYGYVVSINGIAFPIKSWAFESSRDENSFCVKIEADQDYSLEIKESEAIATFSHRLGRQGETKISKIDISVNGQPGRGLSIMEKTSPLHHHQEGSTTKNVKNGKNALVLAFDDPGCKDVGQTGGKGSSLAYLTEASKESNEYSVPRGIVVTSSSYRLIVKNNEIEKLLKTLEQSAWGNSKESLEKTSERVMKAFNDVKFPKSIEEELRQNSQRIFGADYNSKKFAVRSSATGEDSEELSAAGQMDTFLGVQGLENIIAAVKKCWASQFGVVAINYKRNNGQLIDSDMAVVIQEMVASGVAGVMFTCDPSSGDPRCIHITANYGLGESVVSATADPDTITLRKTSDNMCIIEKIQTGGKKISIVMKEDGGTREEAISKENASACCLSEDKAVLLGKIGIELENRYGAPRDIEWAVMGNGIYFLQARPVTSINVETDYEIAHELDTAYRLENNYTSRANVGEVFANAMSFLSLSHFMNAEFIEHSMDLASMGVPKDAFRPYRKLRGLLIAFNHIFFNLSEGMFQLTRKEEESMLSKATTIAMFGREIDLDDLREIGYARSKNASKKGGLFSKIAGLKHGFHTLRNMLTCSKKVKECYKSTWNLEITFEDDASAINMLQTIGKSIISAFEIYDAFYASMMSSSFCNMILLSLLSQKDEGLRNDIYSDFATLLSSCTAVESADVPRSMKKLASLITKCPGGKEFKTKDPKKAEEWLRSSELGGEFRKFLERHGHRCFKEYEFQVSPWRENTEQLIRSLQGLVGNVKDTDHKEQLSVEDAIKKISVQLSWSKKTFLKVILPWCRACVGYREQAKSIMIKNIDMFRKGYRKLASKMVSEGFLPDEDLIYYLTFDEIWILLNTRAPRLVAKAKRRRRYFPTLNSMKFPEIGQGIIEPINRVPNVVLESGSFTMTGTPVSYGVITAPARVAHNLEEAAELKPGEILITHCTDIGWSPYFPLISGIATELGGLISHGAVIAREYGLPCVVGVHGATSVFKTGDLVLLDGKRGILQRISQEDKGA